MTSEQEMESVFDSAGFARTKKLQRTSEFRSRSNGGYVYVNRDRFPRCIHVYIEDTLPSPNIPGINVLGTQFRSNCTKFPRKIHNGRTPCHYGKGIEVDNLATLSDLLKWFHALKT